MFEPLIIGIIFPFISSAPWQLKGTPKMFAVGRTLRCMFKEENLAAGNFLRQFLLECKRLQSLPKDVVRRMLYFESQVGISHQAAGKRAGRKRKEPEGQRPSLESLAHEETLRKRLQRRQGQR